MVLRGARLALVEETPEERRLSVIRLKKLIGTPQIKGRYMHQDDLTFDASHSMFLNTNYKLTVTETDWGTWRRLALLRFPYIFRKPGEALTGDGDRTGDPGLRDRLKHGAQGQHEAILAWLVRGAMGWYAAGKLMPTLPDRVRRDTLEWREQSDLVLGYVSERLTFDLNAHVMSTELHEDVSEWLISRGHRPVGQGNVYRPF